MRNFRKVGIISLAILSLTVLAVGGIKRFSENSILFGIGNTVRSIVFDYGNDPSAAKITVDPLSPEFVFNKKISGNELDMSGNVNVSGKLRTLGVANGSRPCPILTTIERDALTPEEGDCVYNSDDQTYNLYDGAAWNLIAGAGGSGGINHITNPDAEKDTDGYVTFDDGAVSIPVDGTGGTATGITFTRNTTDPLRGTADFLLSKSAVDAQGEGFSYDFSIENADKYRIQYVSFDYSVTSNYADDDVILAIYDVTNAKIIRLNNEDLKASSIEANHLGSFQATDSTSYRLIAMCSSTSALAYDVNLDNIIVGPRDAVIGSIETDWESYTPTLESSGGGAVTLNTSTDYVAINGKWRRDGDTAHIQVSFRNGSGGSASGNAGGILIGLPSGMKADYAKLANSVGGQQLLGYASFNGPEDRLTATPTGDGSIIRFIQLDGTLLSVSDVTASDLFTLNLSVPIQGWSSNAVMSENLGNRLIAARITDATASLSASPSKVTFLNTDYDTAGMVSSGGLIAPKTGYFKVSSAIVATFASVPLNTSFLIMQIRVNGTNTTDRLNRNLVASATAFTIEDTLKLNKGDTVEIYAYSDANSPVIGSADIRNQLSMFEVANPQTLLSSEKVVAVYNTSAGQSVSNGSIINFNSKVEDTHNAVTTGASWTFTAPRGGYAKVSANTVTGSTSTTLGQFYEVVINKNGSNFRSLTRDRSENTQVRPYNSGGAVLVPVNKGDTINVIWSENLPAVNLSTAAFNNQIEIIMD